MFWYDLFTIALITFILTFAVLVVFRFRKNVYLKGFEENELFKVKKEADYKNYIYSTKGMTRKFIRRYVIRRGRYDTTLVCNYNKNFNQISYFVVAYNKRRKPIQVIEVEELNTNTNSSKILVLNRKTAYVNIHMKKVDGEIMNTHFIKPIPRRKAKLFSYIASLCLLSFLLVVRHIIGALVGVALLDVFLKSAYNLIAVIASFIISLLYFIFTYRGMKRRNFKNKFGGKVEYEFF